MIATKMNKNNDIISGDSSPDSFAKTVENLDCLAVFVRAIPQWSADNNVNANIIIKGRCGQNLTFYTETLQSRQRISNH